MEVYMAHAKGTNRWMLLGGLAAGAAALYFLDPDQGQKRRTAFATKAKRMGKSVAEEASKSGRDAWHQVAGNARKIWNRVSWEQPDDDILVERIRARLGRIVSHPPDVHVASDHGTITLWGRAPNREIYAMVRTLGSMHGVREIRNHLEIHERPEAAADGNLFQRARHTTLHNWSPAKRAAVGTAGAAAAIYGWRRKDNLGVALSVLGSGLIAASAMKRNVHSVLALSPDCPGFELDETIRVNAPISDIYQFWVNPRNYPKVFSHVESVEQLGENLYRWTLTGPAGVPVHWDGTITQAIPNTLVEWKSLPGATVGNFGKVRFDPNYDASTRVRVRMFYRPPAGILGRFLAEILGADPRTVLRQDLQRMKMLFETDEKLLRELNQDDTELLKTAGC
jgi:uncharacterized membrane protein